MKSRVFAVISSLIYCAISAQGQLLHPSDPAPHFEVATIKLNDPKVPFFASPLGSRRIVHVVGTLRALIAQAFNASMPQLIVPGLNRVDDQVFRVEAEIPDDMFSRMQGGDTSEARRQTQLMLQGLLRERFGLQTHFGLKEMPVYTIEADKDGSKLPPPNQPPISPSGGWAVSPHGDLRVRNMRLADLLAAPMFDLNDHVILDGSGLDGYYDLKLPWKPVSMGGFASQANSFIPSSGTGISILTVLKDELGLRLVAGRAPVEVVYVDKIDPLALN